MKKEYNIVKDDSVNDLITKVNKYFNEGWECQGGVLAVELPETKKLVFYQSIVREKVVREKKIEKDGGIFLSD
jgi:hypothetical protein